MLGTIKPVVLLTSVCLELMAYADESKWNMHQLDDDTQSYLVEFFKHASTEPDFQNLYQNLTDEEREKLHQMDKPATQ